MRYKVTLFLTLSLAAVINVRAQKAFTEGTIVYKVTLVSEDHKELSGAYTYTFKGDQVRKELQLGNGFKDVTVVDCASGKAYSLQNINGKKYAIELSMTDLENRQQKYAGFSLTGEVSDDRSIAGYAVYKASVHYPDGTNADIRFTKEWRAAQAVAFERFPNANFLPLHFSYTDESGINMLFEAVKVQPGPVENGMFRIPPDYKMISNAEYKQLSR